VVYCQVIVATLATVTKAIKSAIKPEPINSAIILSAYVPMPHAIPFRQTKLIRIPSLPVFHFPFPSSQTMLSLSSFSLQLKVGNFSCHVYLTWQGRRRGTIAIMQIRMADYRITNCNGSNCFALTPDFSICHTQMANRPQVVTAKGRKPRNLLTKCLQTVEMVREWYVGDREQCHATICSRHSATPTHAHTHSDTISHIKKVRP